MIVSGAAFRSGIHAGVIGSCGAEYNGGKLRQGSCEMVLGHDLVWWSFVLSAAALFLGVPMATVGAVLAPTIQNWWAERSKASMRKRITVLEHQLSEYEANYEQLSEVEDWILKGIVVLGMTMAVALTDLCAVLVLARDQKSIFNDPHGIIVPTPVTIALMALITLFIVLVVTFFIFRPIGEFRKRRSPEVRQSLRKSIQNLKSKLPMMQQ